MKNLLSVLLILCSSIAYSQESNSNYSLYYFGVPGDSMVVGRESVLRSLPKKSSEVLRKLFVGDVLYFGGFGERESIKRLTLEGVDAEYIPVDYFLNEERIAGYVWYGNIAITHAWDKNGNLFTYSLKSYDPIKHLMTVDLSRTDANTKNCFHQEFTDTMSLTHSSESKVLSGMGLSNVQSIFRVGHLAEACGVFNAFHYFAWNGKKFIRLPGKKSVADGGVYYYSETLFFPTEHKYGSDLILIRSEDYSAEEIYFEELKETEFKNEIERISVKLYKWNGESFRELQMVGW